MSRRSPATPAHQPVQVLVEVPARAEEIAGLRRRVGAFAADAGFSPERRSAVALAVGEACANAVTHAYLGRATPGTIRVTAAVTRIGLTVEVTDDGRGMAPRPDSPGLGLGLPLIASLATSVEVGVVPTGGTELRMLFAAASASTAGWAQAS